MNRTLMMTIDAIAIALAAALPMQDQAQPPATDALGVTDPMSAAFLVTDGPDEGKTREITTERAEDGWSVTIEGLRVTNLREREDGAIVMVSEELIEEDYRIVFDPPPPMVPADLRAGGAVSETGEVVVFDRSSGERLYSGTYDHTCRRAGWSTKRLPAGDRDLYLIRLHQTVSLDNADMELSVLTGYLPGFGRAYQRVDHTIEKMELFSTTTSRTLELAEPPEGRAGAAGKGG